MFQYTEKVKWNIWISIAFLLLLIPWFYIAFFAHPIADDYCYATLSRRTFFFTEYFKQYTNWNGRYSSNLLVLLNPLLHSFFLYQLAAIFLLCLSWIAYFYFIKVLLRNSSYSRWSAAISLGLLDLFLYQMPAPSEGLFWYTGAITYQAANALALFYFALLIQYSRKHYIVSKWLHLAFSGMLVAFIIGFNETILLILGGFHGLLLFSMYRSEAFRKEFGVAILFLSGICIFSAMALILAPGNAVRSALYPNNHALLHSVVMSVLQTFRFASDWVSNFPFLAFSLFSLPLLRKVTVQDAFLTRLFSCPVSISTPLQLLIVFAGVFPAYWNTGILGQYRTVNTAYFFFLLAWFFNLGCWVSFLSAKPIYSFSLWTPKIRNSVFLILFLVMACTKNGYNIAVDLLYKKVNGFDAEMSSREMLLTEAAHKNSAVILLAPLKNKPFTIFVQDLNPDSLHWINTSYATFFGIKNVTLKKL